MKDAPQTAPDRDAPLEEWQQYARALRAGGMTHFEIAAHLYVDLSHVRRLLDPKAEAASRRWKGAACSEFRPWPGTWREGESLRGRLFIRWLVEDHGAKWPRSRREASTPEATLARKLALYEQGDRNVEVASADEVLTHFDLHLSQTPDYLWCKTLPRGNGGLSLLRPVDLAFLVSTVKKDGSYRKASKRIWGTPHNAHHVEKRVKLAHKIGRQK
jgi:hypothetical protein